MQTQIQRQRQIQRQTQVLYIAIRSFCIFRRKAHPDFLLAHILHRGSTAHIKQVGNLCEKTGQSSIIFLLRNLPHQVQRLFLRIALDQEERTPISPGKNAHVLEDLVTEAPGVDLRVDVLHQLDHQLGLVEGVQVVPALLPDLPGQLTGGVECGGAEQVQKESRVESFVELCPSLWNCVSHLRKVGVPSMQDTMGLFSPPFSKS